MWTLSRNLSAEKDSPNFMHKSLRAICGKGPLPVLLYQEGAQTELCFLHCVLLFDAVWVNHYRFCLLTNGLRQGLSNQNYTNYILVCIYTDQSELHDLDQFGNLIHMKPAKMGTRKGDLVFVLAKYTFGFCPSLCLLGLQTDPCSSAFWVCYQRWD